uniref:Uncharacterized protein n=1 Tax=Anopheles quadriannulatus TaxID=34691 RepID=A0A182XSV9_ANOQN
HTRTHTHCTRSFGGATQPFSVATRLRRALPPLVGRFDRRLWRWRWRSVWPTRVRPVCATATTTTTTTTTITAAPAAYDIPCRALSRVCDTLSLSHTL